jgi:hypothetical protein
MSLWPQPYRDSEGLVFHAASPLSGLRCHAADGTLHGGEVVPTSTTARCWMRESNARGGSRRSQPSLHAVRRGAELSEPAQRQTEREPLIQPSPGSAAGRAPCGSGQGLRCTAARADRAGSLNRGMTLATGRPA